jgi:hypothetical protein
MRISKSGPRNTTLQAFLFMVGAGALYYGWHVLV